MKLGLIGDIHANHFALKAVLQAAASSGVEVLLVTGDLVGYYFFPSEVLELLRPWKRLIVRGNHEEMLHTARRDEEFLARMTLRYGSGLQTAIDQLDEEQLNELCALPHPMQLEIEGCNILLCHGSSSDISRYVYPDAGTVELERCADERFDLVVQGHTHFPMHMQFGHTFLVNPGSVGQPRNRQPGAQWALFDTQLREISMYCEAYDASQLIVESRRRNPDIPYLSEVLLRL